MFLLTFVLFLINMICLFFLYIACYINHMYMIWYMYVNDWHDTAPSMHSRQFRFFIRLAVKGVASAPRWMRDTKSWPVRPRSFT